MFIDETSKPSEKLKAWYLFTEDFIAGTQHLTPIEIGCYVRLLCWNWNKRCKGIPDDAEMINRICSAHTEKEREAAGNIIDEFFILIVAEKPKDNKWQNTRQLREWLYINNRIDASRLNGAKGGRPKNNLAKTPLPLTPTTNINNSNMINFENDIWSKINLKRGSKKRAFKEYSKIKKPNNDLIVNNYNKLIEKTTDKQFVPHLSSWLNGERWEESLNLQPDVNIYDSDSQNKIRIKMFNESNITPFLKTEALKHESDVREAVKKKIMSKERAEELGISIKN